MRVRRLLIFWLGWTLLPVAALAGDFEVIQSECPLGPKVKIEKCLSLVRDRKISKMYFPQVYAAMAYSFFNSGDYLQAVTYTCTEIEIASENMKAEFASGKIISKLAKEAWPKQMSRRYWILGRYQAMARLEHTTPGSEEAYNYAKAELESYSVAIQLNRDNHSAYMDRAKVQSLLCNIAEANSDQATAIRIVRNEGEEFDRRLREYKYEILPSCEPAWRGR